MVAVDALVALRVQQWVHRRAVETHGQELLLVREGLAAQCQRINVQLVSPGRRRSQVLELVVCKPSQLVCLEALSLFREGEQDVHTRHIERSLIPEDAEEV